MTLYSRWRDAAGGLCGHGRRVLALNIAQKLLTLVRTDSCLSIFVWNSVFSIL